MKFGDIKPFTHDANYQINVGWDYLEEWINQDRDLTPDLDPPFQRAHVWTEQQRITFVEFMLRGGKGSNQIRFNCVGWRDDYRGPFVLVDGKQRLEAVRRFMADDLGVFGGHKFSDFDDKLRLMHVDFIIMVNNLPDEESVLQWYLDINAGGVAHTSEELDKVRQMLKNK